MLQHLKQTLQKEKVKLHCSCKDVQLNLCTTTKTDVQRRPKVPGFVYHKWEDDLEGNTSNVILLMYYVMLMLFSSPPLEALIVRTFSLKNQILEFLCWDK